MESQERSDSTEERVTAFPQAFAEQPRTSARHAAVLPGQVPFDSVADQPVVKLVAQLEADGVRGVIVPFIDNGGVTRVKCIPLRRLPAVIGKGIGFGALVSVQTVDDRCGTSARFSLTEPSGDLRLIPDLTATVVLAAQPGWAWIPADQFDQEGAPWPTCARSFLRRMCRALETKQLELLAGFELEWFLGHAEIPDPRPAHVGPAYGAGVLQSEFALDLMTALDAQGIVVETFHPEAAPGQYEVSTAPQDPLGAADTASVVRQTIRAVSARHGFSPSFSPMPIFPSAEGNGAHLHLSLWSKDDRNLFATGKGRFGITTEGESFLAGILRELPALVGVTCPSPASYLRLQPNQWSGAFACWGPENREAALRFISGMPLERDRSTNVEFKPIDPSCNPYLSVGVIIAAGLSGMERGDRLPAPTTANPGAMSADERRGLGIERLPASLGESIAALEASSVIRSAMGDDLFEAFVATRRSELESLGAMPVEEMVRAVRWKY